MVNLGAAPVPTAALAGAPTLAVRGAVGVEGVHADPSSPLCRKVLARVPELATWEDWYAHPRWLSNGHAHTIAATKLRATSGIAYHRQLLDTPDGGTLALDLLSAVEPRVALGDSGQTFVESPPPLTPERPFLLLSSGLGGGSGDTYVRAMAATAASRGWQVGVLNMRSCGGSPVTSPRLFSACRGSTDDVRLAIEHVRATRISDAAPLAAVGWSNGGNIIANVLSEAAAARRAAREGGPAPPRGLDAAASLASPLNMPACSANLDRWFHSAVYNRAIASSLTRKLSGARAYFEDDTGAPLAVPQWEGLDAPTTYLPDVKAACAAKSVREIDEALTRRCFGFGSVDEYYAHASADQRLAEIEEPLFVLNAYDDPIAPGPYVPLDAGHANPNVLVALTAHGGHLGWCERDDPWGGCAWVERATCGFLEAALEL